VCTPERIYVWRAGECTRGGKGSQSGEGGRWIGHPDRVGTGAGTEIQSSEAGRRRDKLNPVNSDSVIEDRVAIVRRGRRLEYFTIAWNAIEGLLAFAMGVVAGSVSLVGFGLDSFIEVTSGSVLLWRMSVDTDVHRRELNEKRALRVVGVCFLLLAAYVLYESVTDLSLKRVPKHSVPGIILACVSLVVMPLLSRAKRTVGRALDSAAMHADAKQTQWCAYLSAILLGGLLLNAMFGLWWADPIAALIMVPLISNEGIDGLRGEGCDACQRSP
jgi:divalent metal cation (Fe/Co/Zn/Cd) transporter